MAIITEEPDSPKPQLTKPKKQPSRVSQPTIPTPKPTTYENPFHFWFYFTLTVSTIALLSIFFSSLSNPQDPKSWFLNLPPILRNHYSSGRAIKVQTAPNHPQVEVFSTQQGPTDSDAHILIIHGLGCSSFAFQDVVKFLGKKGVHAVAIDLPGSGFSDKSIVVVEKSSGGSGPFGRMWEVYEEIKEKGLFWGFDQLVEQGYVDFEESDKKVRVSRKTSFKSVELGGEEMGRVLGQVVESLGLAPVDLVLHDSALGLSANWVAENRGLVRSVVVLDSVPNGTALPLWVLGVPVVREVVLGFRFVFGRVLGNCCMKSVGGEEAEAHRLLLKGRDGGRAIAGIGKNLNLSFDLSEWSGLDGVRDLPIRVVWSSGWSDEWTAQGRQIAEALPQATLVTHSGGRWTQEYNAEEIGASIYEFVSSLPKPAKQVEMPTPEHFPEIFSETKSTTHEHNHRHQQHHEHGDHVHAHAGYMDAYGLGHGWAM